MFVRTVMFFVLFKTAMGSSLCEPPCRCTYAEHPSLKAAYCNLQGKMNLIIEDGDAPDDIKEVYIVNGSKVAITSAALNGRSRLLYMHFKDIKMMHMDPEILNGSKTASFGIVIENAKLVNISPESFKNMKGPVSANFTRCDRVEIGRGAFSWLLAFNTYGVGELILRPGAFIQEGIKASSDSHGPELTINLEGTNIEQISENTFGSSAAEIRLKSTRIGKIKKNAFCALNYNVIEMDDVSVTDIEEGAFAQKTLIQSFKINKIRVNHTHHKAIHSGITNLSITGSWFHEIQSGGINITVASVTFYDNHFDIIQEGGIKLQSWNNLHVINNTFHEMEPCAIDAPFNYASGYSGAFVFTNNTMWHVTNYSLKFVGDLFGNGYLDNAYVDNYYDEPCRCEIEKFVGMYLGNDAASYYSSRSFCNIPTDLFYCFDNKSYITMERFKKEVCGDKANITCPYVRKKQFFGTSEITNTRFPHRVNIINDDENIKYKLIHITLIAVFVGLILLLLLVAGCYKSREYWKCIKSAFAPSSSSCASRLNNLCMSNNDENATSIMMTMNDFSERHALNEPQIDIEMRTGSPNILPSSDPYTTELETPITYTENMETVMTADKVTQTLPEELTKELLETLKKKLDDPNDYEEAREMIEHLYELIKVEEDSGSKINNDNDYEPVYDLPHAPTSIAIGRNKKKMVSVGTRAPSLDKLQPSSPYGKPGGLCHEYFEPKDFAVHLYAEIANYDRAKKTKLSSVPDVVAEQAPRGPYLRAMREKRTNGATESPKMSKTATVRSNTSNGSSKMLNRPLPEKPLTFDPGEATSGVVH